MKMLSFAKQTRSHCDGWEKREKWKRYRLHGILRDVWSSKSKEWLQRSKNWNDRKTATIEKPKNNWRKMKRHTTEERCRCLHFAADERRKRHYSLNEKEEKKQRSWIATWAPHRMKRTTDIKLVSASPQALSWLSFAIPDISSTARPCFDAWDCVGRSA